MRLVIYEGLTRAPTPIFNEKVLAGLGREVQSTGLLAAGCGREGAGRAAPVPRALRHGGMKRAVVRRHRRLPRRRERTGFIAAAERICRKRIDVLTGKQEAQYSALGVISGLYQPDGIVGDLGGGSLELIDVRGQTVRNGITLPLGSLALQDLSEKSVKKAEKIVAQGA